MNFLTPPPSAVRPTRRRFVPRLSEDPDVRSVQIGVVATILLHVVLWVLLPDKFENELVGSFVPKHTGSGQNFNIELAPNEFVNLKAPAPKPPPFKFVETNPDAPENEPDKTNNFGAQNQQAAQEKAPKKEGGDRPEMEGRKDIESAQIVSGRLQEPTLPSPSAMPQLVAPVAEQPTPEARREQNPLPGFEKTEGDNKDTFGTNIAKAAPNAQAVPEKVEGVKDAPLIQGATGVRMTIDRNRPAPRPSLSHQNVRPAIFAENQIGTKNIGPVAVDARWSKYGEYLQKMIETVQIQWDVLLAEGKGYPAPGSMVTVKFKMDANGAISRIVGVEGGLAGPQAEGYCVSAITKRSPYGKWTEDMVAILGTEQEMTFVFFYQ